MALAAPPRATAAPIRPPESPTPVEYGIRRTLIVAGVMLAALLQMIDTTIVNVSLPTIQGNLGATVDQAIWVVTAFVIANVVVIPITPWLQRRFGRKNYFLVSIAGFTAASLFCGLAHSLNMLIIFRIAQGAFGGGLLTTAQMILRDTYGPKELGLSQSIFAFATVLGPSLGPTLGGIITDNYSWPWIFDVNVVPGIVAFLLIARFLRDRSTPSRDAVDTTGIALLVIFIGSFQYVLDQGQTYDWFSDSRITYAALIALAGFIGFVAWELTTRNPIVDLRVLRHRPVTIASLCITANAVGVFGGALLLPQFTIDQLGFTSTQTGILLGLRALPVAFLTFPIGRITNNPRVNLRLLICGGLLCNGLGAMWLGHNMTFYSNFATFAAPLLFAGVGIAFVYSPLLVATLRAVPQEAAKASAFIILSFQMSGSITAAALVTLLDRRETFHQEILAGSATLARAPVQQFLQTHPAAALAQLVSSQATILAYGDVLLVGGIFTCLFAPLALLLSNGRSRGSSSSL